MAVKATALMAGKLDETLLQDKPQSIPPGVLVTVPWPDLLKATKRVFCVAAKLAVTLRAAPIVTVQVGDNPAQAPPQPVNESFPAPIAVKITLLLALKFAEQLAPQLIPAGVLVTRPLPDLATEST